MWLNEQKYVRKHGLTWREVNRNDVLYHENRRHLQKVKTPGATWQGTPNAFIRQCRISV